MKSSSPLIRLGFGIYLFMFFGFLLGPLFLMGITAFNSSAFPQITPWEVFSFEWFKVLFNDERILSGLWNSIIIGFFTVILSVSIGLAGALILTQIWPKLRSTYYTIIIAPILIPGVVLGISTLVFWDRVNGYLGFSSDSFLRNGIFLTVLGQATFISSYCMLVFVARLQRYDTGLTEAALDLGATHVQAFRKIQLPFLAPAIGSAAVLAFLASFENYNTTTFTFMDFPTLTIELSQKVRLGINPSVSALAFIIVCITVFFALLHEVRTRRVQLAEANGAPVGAVKAPKFFSNNPAAVILTIFTVLILGAIAWAQVYDPEPAKAVYRAKEQAKQEQAIKEVQERMKAKRLQKELKGPDIFGTKKDDGAKIKSPGASTFGNVFDTKNLDKVAPAENKKPKPESKIKSPGSAVFGNVFDTKNLDKVAPEKKGSN